MPRPHSNARKGISTDRVLAFCRRFLDRHDRLPFKREICSAFGLRSTYSAKYHLDKLVGEGRLEKEGRNHWRFPRA